MGDVFLVGARYSKSRYRTIRAMGFDEHEIIMGRCTRCHGKIMMHTESMAEWKDIDVVLICGTCRIAVEVEHPITFVGITPLAQSLYEKAMAHLKSN